MAADATHELAKVESRSAKGRQMRFYRAEPLKRVRPSRSYAHVHKLTLLTCDRQVPSDEFLEQMHLESQVKHDKKKRKLQRQEEKERMQAELERGEDSAPSGFIARLGEKLGTLFKRDERSRRERHQRQLIKEELEMPKPVRDSEGREQGQARDGLDPEVTKTKTNLWANLEAELQSRDEQAVWHRLGDVADNAAYRQPIYPALLVR
jgi:NADH dehydrogenase/NADH:ubiquinone oxidoreductase subunit G